MTKAQAEPIVCHACSLQVLGRGGDLEGWKAVQMDPKVPDLRWFCMKPVCQQVYMASLNEAQGNWGYIPEPELDQSELDHSTDQAASDQAEPPMGLEMVEEEPRPAPRVPPQELVAYETSKADEAGYDPELPPLQYTEEEPAKEEPPPAEGRYVPKPSAKSKARFVRHEGTGETGDE